MADDDTSTRDAQALFLEGDGKVKTAGEIGLSSKVPVMVQIRICSCFS